MRGEADMLKKIVKATGSVTGIAPVAKAASKIMEGNARALSYIADDAVKAKSWIASDVKMIKEVLANERPDARQLDAKETFRRHMHAAGHMRSDMPRLISRSALAFWCNLLFAL